MSVKISLSITKTKDTQDGRNTDNESKRSRSIENNHQIETKALTVEEGSELMGNSLRQTYRVLKKIKDGGSAGIIHKLREENLTVDIRKG
jgi:hypothetical protein